MKAIKFDYFRPGRPVSPHGSGIPRLRPVLAACIAALLSALPAAAQYAGKIPESSKKNGPDLRAVAILEWTGDEGHPKASRLVPICLWDGQDLQDASIYMAQPAPLALLSETEYKLKKDGKTIGYYVISGAAQTQGTWVGVGAWKPLTQPKPPEPPKQVAANFDDNDHPVLHRKNHPDNSGGDSKANEPPPDPDRPVLREPPKETKKPDAAQPATDQAYSQPIADTSDPDRPHLFHGKASSTGDQILPTLAGLPQDMNQTVAVSDAADRPDHLWNYSWANPDDETKIRSELEDLARKALAPAPPPGTSKPPVRRHSAATRHAKAAPPPPPLELQDEQFHVFQLTYGGPATIVFSAHTQAPVPAGGTADETSSQLKAGTGTTDETRPPLKAAAGTPNETRPPLKAAAGTPNETRPPLKAGAAGKVSDAGNKDVVPAQSSAAPEKFITLFAQPDLYGNVIVLFKSITDATDLDENPAMHLINPVDAMADNRGELLFELRGATQREFALYRILGGKVEKLFTSSPEAVVIPPIAPPASSTTAPQ